MNKKFLVMLLITTMCGIMAACGSKKTSSPASETTAETTTENTDWSLAYTEYFSKVTEIYKDATINVNISQGDSLITVSSDQSENIRVSIDSKNSEDDDTSNFIMYVLGEDVYSNYNGEWKHASAEKEKEVIDKDLGINTMYINDLSNAVYLSYVSDCEEEGTKYDIIKASMDEKEDNKEKIYNIYINRETQEIYKFVSDEGGKEVIEYLTKTNEKISLPEDAKEIQETDLESIMLEFMCVLLDWAVTNADNYADEEVVSEYNGMTVGEFVAKGYTPYGYYKSESNNTVDVAICLIKNSEDAEKELEYINIYLQDAEGALALLDENIENDSLINHMDELSDFKLK